MRKRIFRNTAVLVIISIVLTFLAMSLVMYNRTYNAMQTAVEDECEYLKASIDESGTEFLTPEIAGFSDSRITLIDTDGTVLFESEEAADQMENHAERKEFQEALDTGEGSDSRSSATFSEQTYYYALRLDNGMVIRVANTADNVWGTVLSGLGIAIALIVILVIASLIYAKAMTNRIMKPINELDLEHPMENGKAYEEISPLLGRINRQKKQIADQMVQLQQNQEEYMAITENMKDGLIVTNRTAVLAINRSAQRLFGVTQEECVNHDIITVNRNEVLKEALEEALSGQESEKILQLGERYYQLLANPVRVSEEISGAVILVLDVTEKQEAEKMRREFSANVSHELKTPLMSISGYAEIIEHGMVRQEDIPNFAGRIHAEASRLTNLVEDIIRLSRLDEAEGTMPREETDLNEICEEVKKHLDMSAKDRGITFSYKGEKCPIDGVRQVLYEMVYNLCDNAIKYNKKNGSVDLRLRKENGAPVLAVADTGIGIEPEETERIFERFYRVDKSHSKETGGTGLGLSIVKHAALLHNAKISVDSTPGAGTRIEIRFPEM
ncbi:MAG TPA: PAS domain S-box protein [Candidatus Scatomonas pullistercoris]|uniref:histidine kinase n=1 Tax=Candidatus Scatomonas pullistercoris TaxID=2840920 RepID=A0A9D1TAE8_9FIRM|nr:PAS domain S-box protein [Candidatus Scatomonas pullistercoris]